MGWSCTGPLEEGLEGTPEGAGEVTVIRGGGTGLSGDRGRRQEQGRRKTPPVSTGSAPIDRTADEHAVVVGVDEVRRRRVTRGKERVNVS